MVTWIDTDEFKAKFEAEIEMALLPSIEELGLEIDFDDLPSSIIEISGEGA